MGEYVSNRIAAYITLFVAAGGAGNSSRKRCSLMLPWGEGDCEQ